MIRHTHTQSIWYPQHFSPSVPVLVDPVLNSSGCIRSFLLMSEAIPAAVPRLFYSIVLAVFPPSLLYAVRFHSQVLYLVAYLFIYLYRFCSCGVQSDLLCANRWC